MEILHLQLKLAELTLSLLLLQVQLMPAEPLSVQEKIVAYAAHYGVDRELALDLARFESNFNPNAKNPTSSAKGVYQWIHGSWKAFCTGEVFNPDDNIRCAMRVISEGGLSHWLADPRTKNFLIKNGHIP